MREALFIGTDETSAGPFNIQIPLAGLHQLQNSGNSALCDGSGSLFMGRFCLMTAGAPCYSTAAPNLDPKQRLFLLTHLSLYLRTNAEKTGLGLHLGEALKHIGSPLRLPRDLSGFVHSLLGRGQGLTPSGDDFLVGVMAVLPYKSLANEVVRQSQCEGATGIVSRAFFHAAAERHFNEDICLMLDAAVKLDQALLFRLFERIKGFGHSSGLDLLAGMHFGLRFLLRTVPCDTRS